MLVNMTEYTEWRDIPSFPGYQASSLGQIREYIQTPSVSAPGRILNIWRHTAKDRDYVYVRDPHGDSKARPVHKLVAEAFHGPCPPGFHVHHADGDRQNNWPSNLENVSGSWNSSRGRSPTYAKMAMGGIPELIADAWDRGWSLHKLSDEMVLSPAALKAWLLRRSCPPAARIEEISQKLRTLLGVR